MPSGGVAEPPAADADRGQEAVDAGQDADEQPVQQVDEATEAPGADVAAKPALNGMHGDDDGELFEPI
jgi:hypothetical protein